jgi:methionyl-tRNA synthetase
MEKKETITITHMTYEQSMGFTGWRYIYVKHDKFNSVGDFAEELLETYDKLFNIKWVDNLNNIIKRIRKNG